MIVINAGAYKNGSTWVQNIINTALPKSNGYAERVSNYVPPPMSEEFAQTRTAPDHREILWKALNYSDNETKNYAVFKIHFYADELLDALKPNSDNKIRFINIIRDPRDVLVSRFYHEKVARFDGGFDEFFDKHGRSYLSEYVKYHSFWKKFKSERPALIHQMSFESLKTNFEPEVCKLFKFLDFEDYEMNKLLPLIDIQTNRKEFTQNWMKSFKKDGGNFYRKGIIGDYMNHMSQDQLEQFANWSSYLGYNEFNH